MKQVDYFIIGVGFVGCVLVNWFFVDLFKYVIFLEVGGFDKQVNIFILGVYVKLFCIKIDWVFWLEL